MRSLPDQTQVVNGLSGAAYMMHATELLNLRPMLLGQLIDSTRWQRKVTHPPLLFRTAMLWRVAEGIAPGGGEGLESLHEQLASLNNEIIGEAGGGQDAIVATVMEC